MHTDEEIIAAAKIAQADRSYKEFPVKYDTMIAQGEPTSPGDKDND